MRKYTYALLGVLGLGSTVASAAEGEVDSSFTAAAESLKGALSQYVAEILPILGECLVIVFAFVALWAVYRVVRRVLSSAA